MIITLDISKRRFTAQAANSFEFQQLGNIRFSTRASSFEVDGPTHTIVFCYYGFGNDDTIGLLRDDAKKLRLAF